MTSWASSIWFDRGDLGSLASWSPCCLGEHWGIFQLRVWTPARLICCTDLLFVLLLQLKIASGSGPVDQLSCSQSVFVLLFLNTKLKLKLWKFWQKRYLCFFFSRSMFERKLLKWTVSLHPFVFAGTTHWTCCKQLKIVYEKTCDFCYCYLLYINFFYYQSVKAVFCIFLLLLQTKKTD